MLAESDINELLKDRYLEPIKQISKEVEENKRLILNEFLKSYNYIRLVLIHFFHLIL